MINYAKLKAPFDPKRVSWRVGSTNAEKTKGMALAYIDARDVQDRLDEVCGPENWQCRYLLQGQTTICEIGVKIEIEWVWKADGAGGTDVEAEKGALSDSFKRAAVKWGVGRYLYDLDSPWVELEARGRSYIIKPSEKAKLEALLTRSGASPALREAPDSKPAYTGEQPSGDKSKAVAWTEKMLPLIRTMSFDKLSAWSDANADGIARMRAFAPTSHEQVIAAIRDRFEALVDKPE